MSASLAETMLVKISLTDGISHINEKRWHCKTMVVCYNLLPLQDETPTSRLSAAAKTQATTWSEIQPTHWWSHWRSCRSHHDFFMIGCDYGTLSQFVADLIFDLTAMISCIFASTFTFGFLVHLFFIQNNTELISLLGLSLAQLKHHSHSFTTRIYVGRELATPWLSARPTTFII